MRSARAPLPGAAWGSVRSPAAARVWSSSESDLAGGVVPERVVMADVADEVVERGVPALRGDPFQRYIEVGGGGDETGPQASTAPAPRDACLLGPAAHHAGERFRDHRGGPQSPGATDHDEAGHRCHGFCSELLFTS